MARVRTGPRRRQVREPGGSRRGVWEGRLRLWVAVRGLNALGPGKVRLLDSIARTKSLSTAAKELRMSYRAAWKHLRLVEERTGVVVVEPHRGGRSGGGTELTPEGKALLQTYHSFRAEIEAHVAEACLRHFARWSTPEIADASKAAPPTGPA